MEAAAALLAEAGRDALTTRAVVEAAGIQKPTLHRLLEDKTGLLDPLAEGVLAAYVAAKAEAAPDPDPLAEFRKGWDRHVGFGMAHPAMFAIMRGEPDPERVWPAAVAGQVVLRRKVRSLGVAGLLRVTEARAVDLSHAACTRAVLFLLDVRDAGLAAEA